MNSENKIDAPKINILLVDDKMENLVALHAILQNPSYNLVDALSGEEALRHLLHDDFAVILLDVMMPDMDGLETASIIRERVKTQHTPIIFLTAIGKSDDYVFKGYSLGAVDYIIKPITPIILKSKVSVFADIWSMHEKINKYTQELESSNKILEEKTIELERRRKDMEEFATFISHDLREPLRVMSLSAEKLIASGTKQLESCFRETDNKDSMKHLNRICESSKRLTNLINDSLTIARLGVGDVQFNKTDCNYVVKQALHDLEVAIRESNADITIDPLPHIMANETYMVQLFSNLISNAIKYQKDKTPKINIKADRQESEWVFSVIDNGIGIESKYFEKIFGLFKRLHANSEYNGTGAGLSICKKIVEIHRGRIWVESRIGEGSTFKFAIRSSV